MEKVDKQWAGNTGGGVLGHNFLLFLLRHAPIQVGYFLMIFSIPVYLVIHPKERDALYDYFRRRHKYSRLKSALCTVRNHYIFGKVVIDKFAMWAHGKQKMNIKNENSASIEEMLNRDEGFMMLSAHVGNFELAGYALKQTEKKIYTVVYGGETRDLQNSRKAKMSESNLVMVPVSADSSHIFALNTALDEGNIVSMTGDRIFGSDKSHTANFFGAAAKFPIGAFRLAAVKNVRIIAVFVMKGRGLNYNVLTRSIDVEPVENETTAKRAARLADRFAETLEDVMKLYPLQWFNFYDFWED